jgi:hypothetical protein
MGPDQYMELTQVRGFCKQNGESYQELILNTFSFLTDEQKEAIQKLKDLHELYAYLKELGYEITHVHPDVEAEIEYHQEWETYLMLIKKHLHVNIGISDED